MGLGFRIKARHWWSTVVSPGWWCPYRGSVLANSSPWGTAQGSLCARAVPSRLSVWTWPISGDKSLVVHMKAMLCQLVPVPKNSSWPAFFLLIETWGFWLLWFLLCSVSNQNFRHWLESSSEKSDWRSEHFICGAEDFCRNLCPKEDTVALTSTTRVYGRNGS